MTNRLFHLTLRQSFDGQLVQNGYWFRTLPDSPVPPSDLAMAGIIAGTFQAQVLPAIQMFANQQVQFEAIVVATIVPVEGAIFETILETSNGVQPNNSLPTFCAGLLSLRTGLGGRSNRGRSYYAGISEDSSSVSRLDADSFARLQDVGNSLLSAFGPTPTQPFVEYGVWSRLRGENIGGDSNFDIGAGFTPITQCVARRLIATQRHRKIGHGT